jgi:serine/threonine protein kinase/tetratricopeptide (TPR) repeat protein
MIGRTLTNYRVVSQLGAGGMGVVYEAVDLRLNRTVALKLLPPEKSGDADRRARFLQEARSASALNDPHIVTIHDIFTEAGTDVLVMEHVKGRTLREVISEGPAKVADALDFVLQVAQGVGTAHAAGIVHRDLKPGNIMVTDRGRVKVLDFGLAKLTRPLEDQATMSGPNTAEGMLLGTVDYMSPEQARGEPIDHRSDMFSLGCILYELLTGTRPFHASHPLGVLHEIVFGTITPPRDRRPDVGADADAIVMRALERDVSRRYQSMEALASDLRLAHRRITDGMSAVSASTLVPPPAIPSGVLSDPQPPIPARVSLIPAADAASGRTARRSAHGRSRGQRLLIVATVLVSVTLASSKGREWITQQLSRSDGRSADTVRPPAMPATPYEMTQQGLTLLKRYDRPGNIDSAIQLFDVAIVRNPDYAPAHAAIAKAYERHAFLTGDKSWKARAVDAARHAVELDPYLAEAHVSLGMALAAAGDHKNADTALRRALALEPQNSGAWFALADIAYAEDRRGDASAGYRKALELKPDDWGSAIGAGNVAYRDGRYDEAIEWYARAVALAPDAARPHFVLGAAHVMKGDFAAGAAALQKSISIQPTDAAYTNLGTALFVDGRYRESVAAFEKGVELRPSNPLMWGNLGDAYRWTTGGQERSRNAYLRATQLLEQQLSREPANVRDRSRLALYLSKQGDTRRALTELGTIADLANRDVNTLYRAAVTYELSGNRQEALRWLGRALENGYSMRDVTTDPELAGLRGDVRYQRLATGFERRSSQ